jgi:predicted nucleic acid-binding protein
VTVLLDTSALVALLDQADSHHARATEAWRALISAEEDLVISNYLLVETFALAQRRYGMAVLRSVCQKVLPLLRQVWVSPEDHDAALAAFQSVGRDLSLVDLTSFQLMRRLHIRRAFTLDRHFADQGFEVLPS